MAAASSSTTADSSYEAQELNALLLNSSSAQEICNACRAVESFVSRHNADQARYFYTISFPILLHKIFGFEDVSQPASSRVSTQSGGWIDLTSSPNNEQAANALINLLMPTGVLLSALFSADEENLVRYVFPSERLPSWIHSMLQSERGSYVLSEVCPALFKGRLKEDANGGLQVQLNVFEYYMFWFAYYPVCKENITGDNILSNSNDINMGSRRGSRSRFEKWASSIPGLPGSHHRVNPRKFNSSPYLQLVHLYLHRFVPFKAFIASPSSHIAFPSPAGMPVQSLFREEHSLFSRAEFVFHTFVQFWLVDNDPSPLPLSTCHSLGISFPFNNTCYSYVSPSADLIEVSRLLVNYLNSSLHLPKEELNSLPFSESQASLRWAITRQADAASFRASSSSFQKSLILLSPWSSLLRRPLYRSILRAFTFWPLGGSMKKAAQVVDVWLDYIEPWNTVAEGETEHILEEDVYLEAENKLLSDPAKISSPMPQRLLLKQKINNISGRSTVQGSMGEMRISYQYTDRWQNYVVANYHFYTSLVNHFLVFAHKFVHIDTEAILQMTHKVHLPSLNDLLMGVLSIWKMNYMFKQDPMWHQSVYLPSLFSYATTKKSPSVVHEQRSRIEKEWPSSDDISPVCISAICSLPTLLLEDREPFSAVTIPLLYSLYRLWTINIIKIDISTIYKLSILYVRVWPCLQESFKPLGTNSRLQI